jgi:hypothetical protein
MRRRQHFGVHFLSLPEDGLELRGGRQDGAGGVEG